MPRKYKVKNKATKKKLAPFIVFSVAVLLALYIGLQIFIYVQPPIKNLAEFKPGVVTTIYASDEQEVIKTFNAYNFEKKDIDEIPDLMKKAVIATEDKNFYNHQGFDSMGLMRSTLANLKSGRVVQGASTITQQLARILFLSNEKSIDRKLREFVISVRIEKTLTKDEILGMYLNNIYLGSGAYGVAGAAKIYFNKTLNELTIAETALIAGLPQAPSVYSPFNNPDKAIKRRNQVLDRMYKMKYITKDQRDAAKEEKLHLNPTPAIYTLNKAPYFVDYVMQELDALGFDEKEISQGGYKITTTLDYAAQRAADNAINNNLRSYGALNNDNIQAAVFSYSPITGKILAYVGGKDYSKSQYDRVSQAIRPPGSSFKPFVYTAAVEQGMGPNDEIDDLPIQIDKWTPRNYGNTYRGKGLPMYAGLMISSNVMTVRLIKEVGIRSVIGIARTLGISTPIEYDYTIALGSNGVKLNEMTVAYGAFANGGFKVTPYAVEKVETSKGKIIYKAPKTKTVKVLDLNTAATITAMLETVIKSGTGTAANINKPAAGKTGTTDDYKDAWFIGYTPDIATGVWVGSDNSKSGTGMTGGTVPARIWKDVMSIATEAYGSTSFDYPPVELNFSKLPAKIKINPNDYIKKQESEETKNQQQLEQSTEEKAPEEVQAPAINPNRIRPIDRNDLFDEKTSKNLSEPLPPIKAQ